MLAIIGSIAVAVVMTALLVSLGLLLSQSNDNIDRDNH